MAVSPEHGEVPLLSSVTRPFVSSSDARGICERVGENDWRRRRQEGDSLETDSSLCLAITLIIRYDANIRKGRKKEAARVSLYASCSSWHV